LQTPPDALRHCEAWNNDECPLDSAYEGGDDENSSESNANGKDLINNSNHL